MKLIDLEPDNNTLHRDVINGLGSQPKTLPCKYFYDEIGAALFEQICEQDEYYPTRTELAIFDQHLPEIAACIGRHAVIIEPGSGAGTKTRRLLAALDQPDAYVPIDISREQLQQYSDQLRAAMPSLTVQPVCADFTAKLPASRLLPGTSRTIYFPGSTIGNFAPAAAAKLLTQYRELAGPQGKLLIGVDLKKAKSRLEAAYNDKAGVTAAFNLNLLSRINREIGAEFDLNQFQHHAVWDENIGAIKMLLISQQHQAVRVNGAEFMFRENEAICTEHSYKHSPAEFKAMAAKSGWQAQNEWTDEDGLFGLFLFAA